MFIIPSWSNHGSGFRGGGPSFPSRPKWVTASNQSTNISNSIPFRRWGISRSRLDNSSRICLHIRLYIKILLFIQFRSYMFYNVFSDSFALMVYIIYFISFFVHETIPILLLYIVIVSIINDAYIVRLTSFFDHHTIVLS